MRNIYNLPIFSSCMNDTETIRRKVSFQDLKIILYYFPLDTKFKADPRIFCNYFSQYSTKDLKRRFHELAEKEYEHHVLIRTEFTDIYLLNPDFKSAFKPQCTEEKRLVLEDISNEIWRELKRKRKTFKIK